MPPVMKAFEIIATAKVSTSAFEARDLLFLHPQDEIVMNRDRVLARAKDTVLRMARDYAPIKTGTMRLPGLSGCAALEMAVRDFVNKGIATPHDAIIAKCLARVLSGGDTDPIDPIDIETVLRLERDAVIQLAKTPETRARVTHMIHTGKPLRN
jgi:3-hydroxyacyl-CoA dehydrogenase